MSGVRYCAVPLLLAVAAVSGAAPDTLPTAKPLLPVRVERGITYSAAGGEKLLLDVATPAGGGPYPAVLLLHGGAWRGGSRTDLSRAGKDKDGKPTPSVIETVAAHGYVAATAAYRLAPKHIFPAQIEDARTAVRFLRANAGKYSLDPDKVGAIGFSAGAHLALLLGTADRSAESDGAEYPEQSGRVTCVVSFFGPTDLSLYAASPGLEDAYMVPLLGKECKTDPAVYKRASPIECVTKDDPPVLMIHGTADVIVPVIHSERMLKKLQDAGVTAELITVKGGGHGWTGPVVAKTTADAVRFLDEHLKGKK
ncbi:MAG: nlhH 2 [Gemmataceae bacterium]|nr:nlhH 2 [Gemmataceae bacterium]